MNLDELIKEAIWDVAPKDQSPQGYIINNVKLLIKEVLEYVKPENIDIGTAKNREQEIALAALQATLDVMDKRIKKLGL